MTDDVEWYIARDGKQHGPLTSVEMQKFVELGHLKQTDLVWCPDFTDWRNGFEVFPAAAAPRQAPPEPAPQPQTPPPDSPPETATASQPAHQPAMSQKPQPGSPYTTGGPFQTAAQPNRQFRPDPDQLSRRATQYPTNGAYQPGPAGGGRPPYQDPRHPHPIQQRDPRQPGGTPHPGGRRLAPAPFPAMPDPATGHGPRNGHRSFPQDRHTSEDTSEAPPRRGRGIIWTVAAIFSLASIGALAWFGFKYLGPSNSLDSVHDVVDAQVRAIINTVFDDPAAYKLSPFDAKGTTPQDVDNDLQTKALWRILKTDHKDWYSATVANISQLRSTNQPDQAVHSAIAKAIVGLRRDNSKHALAASPDSFVDVARSFVNSLRALEGLDPKICYEFISYGEGGGSVMANMANPAVTEPLHRQFAAIFTAVRNGRAKPKAYGTAIKEDYDALSSQLTGKHNWVQSDLQTFSSPQLLSQSPPEKVCNLVQDWFTAQIELKDDDLRARLLFESLRPLIAG